VKPTHTDAGDALRVAGAGPYVSRSPQHNVLSRGGSHKSSTNSELIIQETGDGEGGEPISRTCFPWGPRPYVKSRRLHVFPSFETRPCVAPRCRPSHARALATCMMFNTKQSPCSVSRVVPLCHMPMFSTTQFINIITELWLLDFTVLG